MLRALPIRAHQIHEFRSRPLTHSYSGLTDVMEIEGVKYAGELFRRFSFAPIGAYLQIVGREDGVVSVRSYDGDPIVQAEFEMAHDKFRAAVEAEKARIIASSSWWKRIADVLPFTIVMKKEI